MNHIQAMEWRLSDLERDTDVNHRVLTVVDTKFDKDLKRWFVKCADSATSQGQTNSNPDADPNFKSAWLPWQSFAHGTIKMTVTPRKNQKVVIEAPYGRPEMGHVKPYHNYPNANCPTDGTPDVFHLRVEAPTDDKQSSSGSSDSQSQQKQQSDTSQILDIVGSKDGLTLKLGSSSIVLTKDKVTINADTFEVTSKHFNVTASEDSLVKAKEMEIRSSGLYLGQKDGAINVKRIDDTPSGPVFASLDSPDSSS